MNLYILFAIFIAYTLADSPCGDWLSYRDEKCFTVIDTLVSESAAGAICENQKATFGLISSAEEQDLVYNYLKNKGFIDNVWIAIKKKDNLFKSIEGDSLKYTSWNAGRPVNQSDVDCVEMDLDYQGKWVDVKCEKKNAVLCEKNQQWSNSKIENILQELRQNYTDKFTSIHKEFQSLFETQKHEIDYLKANPVPIGFIYVQLSGQTDPQILWPNTKWNNVSPNYAGLFFRAEGGNASKFGSIQEEQTQTIFVKNEWPTPACEWNVEHAITSTYPAKSLFSGANGNSNEFSLNFKHSTDEIRPRNQAIRIWIRIK